MLIRTVNMITRLELQWKWGHTKDSMNKTTRNIRNMPKSLPESEEPMSVDSPYMLLYQSIVLATMI